MDTLRPEAEVTTSAELLRDLLAEQCPDLADEEIRLVGEGWDNVTWRVGERRAARLPRRALAVPLLLHEQVWLGSIADRLEALGPDGDVAVPRVRRIGRPSDRFPWPWSVVDWVDGEAVDVAPLAAGQGERLARVLRALHAPAPPDAPANPFRGVPLDDRAVLVHDRLNELEARGHAATEALRTAWTEATAAPRADEAVWLHGDLHPRNVVVRNGRLAGLLDWGDLTGGDAATDLAAGWTLLRSGEERLALREGYGGSDDLWARARGWATLFATALVTSGSPGHEAIGAQIVEQLVGAR